MHGIALILCAFPAGWLADRFSRQFTLRIAGILGYISVAVSLVAFSTANLSLLYVVHLLWGGYNGLFAPAVDSLFADSAKQGLRSNAFAWKHMVRYIDGWRVVLGLC